MPLKVKCGGCAAGQQFAMAGMSGKRVGSEGFQAYFAYSYRVSGGHVKQFHCSYLGTIMNVG